ncbi:hypothetical protein [Roseateles albus]|uniref:hypothetical protein n=1 Tax=Roseateles albus TaxID=2987525 RepID=UPI0039648022
MHAVFVRDEMKKELALFSGEFLQLPQAFMQTWNAGNKDRDLTHGVFVLGAFVA